MNLATLFLDESGKSSLAEKENEPFLLTGVILEQEEISPVQGFFNYIKLKYKIDTNKPFHSYHIFEDPREKLHPNKTKYLIESLADFLSIIPIRVNILSVDKSEFKKALGVLNNEDFKGSSERKEMKGFPYRIMSAWMFKWFGYYLKKNNSIGQIITDSRRGGDEQLLRSLNLCKDPNSPLDGKISELIKDRCNAICFAEKNFLSGGLEITDLISYIAFSQMKKESNIYTAKLKHVWLKIKNRLKDRKVCKISSEEIKNFFKVNKDGVHKYLKN